MEDSILIVGPGYVGEPLARKLVDEGRHVIAASRSGIEIQGCRAISIDVTHADSIKRGFDDLDRPAAVIHCASSSRGGTESYRAVYLEGVSHLAAIFPGVPLFFTSSTSAYPQTEGEEVTEESPANPETETGRILREAENVVLANQGCVLRLSGIYGPGRSIHLKRILSGTAQIESGEPSRYLNQIHRKDIISAVTHLLRGDPETWRGEIYNVNDDESLTMRTCYEWLALRFGKDLGPETPPTRDGKRAWTNKLVKNGKLRSTGWRPLYPTFRDAIEMDTEFVDSIKASIFL